MWEEISSPECKVFPLRVDPFSSFGVAWASRTANRQSHKVPLFEKWRSTHHRRFNSARKCIERYPKSTILYGELKAQEIEVWPEMHVKIPEIDYPVWLAIPDSLFGVFYTHFWPNFSLLCTHTP